MDKIHRTLMNKSGLYASWHNHDKAQLMQWLVLILVVSFMALLLIDRAKEPDSVSYGLQSNAEEVSFRNQQAARFAKLPYLTKDLLNLANKLRTANAAEKLTLLDQIQALAGERKQLLLNTVAVEPRLALNSAISPSLRGRVPIEVRSLIEEKKTIKGKFENIILDDTDHGRSEQLYFVTDAATKKRYRVHFDAPTGVQAMSGATVSIIAFALDTELVAPVSDMQVLAPSVLTATGSSRRVAAIMFNWQNNPIQSWTAADIRGILFTNAISSNSYYRETSFGQLELTGDVFGWYTIPYDNTDCSSNFGIWSTAADAAVQAAGVDLSSYDHKAYFFPGACSMGGAGEVGGVRSWNAGRRVDIAIHELGHNFGLHHASGYSCTESGVRVPISSTPANCVVEEYRDLYDIMGDNPLYHTNNYHKGQSNPYKTNWFGAANTQTVDRSTSSDTTYTLVPIEQGSAGVQVLRVPLATPRVVNGAGSYNYYYLEYRQPFGFDNNLSGTPAVNGISIRLGPDYQQIAKSLFIDTTPISSGFTDAPLGVGKTFTDPANSISITTISTSASAAMVRVSVGTPCTSTPPTVAVAPASQTGNTGDSLIYNVTVTNSNCAGSYNLTLDPHTGFTQSPVTTSVLGPGEQTTVPIIVTSGSTVPVGDTPYLLSATATNTANSAVKSSAQFAYVVASAPPPPPADTTAPTTSITFPANNATVRRNASVTIQATASDNVSVTKVEFYVNNVLKCTDMAVAYSCTWKVPGTKNATFNLQAKAYDAAGNVGSSSIIVVRN